MGPPGQPPSRRSTQEALDKLAKPRERITQNTAWYTAGVDFCFYAPAQEACNRSIERLRKLNLDDEELDLLANPPSPEDFVAKLKVLEAHQEDRARRSTLMKRTSEFVNVFCEFANRCKGIILLLTPQSPEYSVTFGMMLIVFNAVVTKKEREESLLEFVQTLSSELPIVDFYKTVFPTNAMKATVARIYVEIMKLLDEAVAYYRGGRLSMIVDAVMQPKSKFDVYIANIETEIKNMNHLKDAASVAQAADMMEVVQGTGLVVARIYENFESTSSAIGTSIEILNRKLDSLTANTNKMLHFEMLKHTRSLQEALLADTPAYRPADEELSVVLGRNLQLSQKDRWENNGVLDELILWSRNARDKLFWIGGDIGNQDAWVTDLSRDIVQALQPQLLTLLFAFCDQPANEPLTPILVVKSLFAQLLDLHPGLAYQNPEVCNLWRVRRAVTFSQVWRIFEDLALRVANLFVVVDRVEQCEADEQADVSHQLFPALVGLVQKSQVAGSEASVIVTSIYEPPELPEELEAWLYSVDIDTTKRPKKR